MWWLHLLLGIPAVLMGLEAVKALWPWVFPQRLAPLVVVALAFGVSYLPIHGHIMTALDTAMAVPLLMKYLGLSSSYQSVRVHREEITGRVLLAWDDLSDKVRGAFRRKKSDHETAGTMLPPNVGRRIPSL